MSHLTPFHRRLLRYRGIPAADVARIEHCTVETVMAGWNELRARGHLPSVAEPAPNATEQLTFGQVDALMREPPTSAEVGHTTVAQTDGERERKRATAKALSG